MNDHNSPPAHPTISILGLGPMGQALAAAALRSGYPTLVWNRSPDKAAHLLECGAVLVDTPAEAVRQAGVVIGCVLNYEAMAACLDGVGTWNGTSLVNLTSGRPDQSRKMAIWAAARGARYLEGAILTPTPTIGTPAATVLYCGPGDLFQTHRNTLSALGGTATYLGESLGVSKAYEVALLDLFSTTVSGVTHALALASAEGLAPEAFAPYAAGMGALLPELVCRFAKQLADGVYPGDRSTIASASSGIAHVIGASQRKGIDTEVLRAMQAVVDRAVAAGYGPDGLARLAQTLQPE